MKDLKNTKFFNAINRSDKDILQQRAELVAGDVEQSLRDIVDKLKQQLRQKESEKLKLQDFDRKTSDSLEVIDGNFDPTQWSLDLHSLSVDIFALKQELTLAEKNYEEFFGEEKATIEYKSL